MALRFGSLVIGAVLLASQWGCCCLNEWRDPWPCGKTYFGPSCGCCFWHEWFSHKPTCCEPCDQCGGFTASNNPYVKAGPPRGSFGAPYEDGSGPSGPGSAGQLYPTPAAEPTPAPAPAPAPATTNYSRGMPNRMTGYGPSGSGNNRISSIPQRTRLFSR